jgi:hypothetical protein
LVEMKPSGFASWREAPLHVPKARFMLCGSPQSASSTTFSAPPDDEALLRLSSAI